MACSLARAVGQRLSKDKRIYDLRFTIYDLRFAMHVKVSLPAFVGLRLGRRRLLLRGWAGFALLLAVAAVLGGHTVGFFSQAGKGEYPPLAHQRAFEKLEAGPGTN